MPDLQAFHASHAKAGVFVIAIESGEPANQVVSFVQNYGLTFPIWLDPQSLALEVVNYFNFPSSYVIDKSGKVRLSSTGEVNLPTLYKYITPLLEE